jgi:hypothetical protein
VRITSRYDEADFTQAVLAVVHETGHALYEPHKMRSLVALGTDSAIRTLSGVPNGAYRSQEVVEATVIWEMFDELAAG